MTIYGAEKGHFHTPPVVIELLCHKTIYIYLYIYQNLLRYDTRYLDQCRRGCVHVKTFERVCDLTLETAL